MATFKKTNDGYVSAHQPVIYTTDAVVFSISPSAGLSFLAYERTDANEPFFGRLALPGGMIHTDSDANDKAACERVLKSKLGFKPTYLEQLKTFSGAARDPRGWSATVAYLSLVPWEEIEAFLKTSKDATLIPVSDLTAGVVSLAFDHEIIVKAAVDRVQAKARYSSMPCLLLPEKFTILQLLGVYEAIRNEKIDMASFRRKLSKLEFVEAIDNEFQRGVQRPAQLYRMKGGEPILFDSGL